MNSDFRVSVGVFGNPKILRLAKRLGDIGIVSLFRLWAYAAVHRPDGKFADPTEIELAIQWRGNDGELIGALRELRLLDEVAGAVAIHDWETWQPWASGATERSELARRNAHRRYCAGAGKCDKPFCDNATARSSESDAVGKAAAVRPASREQSRRSATAERSACDRQAVGTAPSPSPLLTSPNPSPEPKGMNGSSSQQAVGVISDAFSQSGLPVPAAGLLARWLGQHEWDAEYLLGLIRDYLGKGEQYISKVVSNPANKKSSRNGHNVAGGATDAGKFADLVAGIAVVG